MALERERKTKARNDLETNEENRAEPCITQNSFRFGFFLLVFFFLVLSSYSGVGFSPFSVHQLPTWLPNFAAHADGLSILCRVEIGSPCSRTLEKRVEACENSVTTQ